MGCLEQLLVRNVVLDWRWNTLCKSRRALLGTVRTRVLGVSVRGAHIYLSLSRNLTTLRC